MEKYIPYEKLSKKEKRKLDSIKRGTWGAINPVTRKPTNSKAYNRSKARNWKRDYHETNSGSFHTGHSVFRERPWAFLRIPPHRGVILDVR